jgi:hypothetical protein
MIFHSRFEWPLSHMNNGDFSYSGLALSLYISSTVLTPQKSHVYVNVLLALELHLSEIAERRAWDFNSN